MLTHINVGAAAPGLAAPEPVQKDETPGLAGTEGFRGQGTTDSSDSAIAIAPDKLQATLKARASMLGIEVRRLVGGAWLLCHARGADIGVVHGLDALVAAVSGFERAVDDARRLVQSLRGAA